MPTGIRINVLKYTFHYKFTNIAQYIFSSIYSFVYKSSTFIKCLEMYLKNFFSNIIEHIHMKEIL